MVNAGKVSGYDGTNTKKVLPDFVNKLLESVYSKKFMAEHSLTGNQCPSAKGKKKILPTSAPNPTTAIGEDAIVAADAVVSTSTKPSLPEEDVKAIIGSY